MSPLTKAITVVRLPNRFSWTIVYDDDDNDNDNDNDNNNNNNNNIDCWQGEREREKAHLNENLAI